ncbi:hypothetical protein [Schinkia azotoformans]|uniref:hypothetical protein n=1 Tax=Schinkia azotoformans TaxID=1454 RepID=UPI002DBE9594|nr:hypothetical protein [Schinkia azotoformans]MEC1744159.1 hypothetical protein [Schinkia azotoformans]
MFTSSKDFERALFNTLKAIQHGIGKFENVPKGLSDVQFFDVLEYALKNNYLKGIRPHLEPDGVFSCSSKFLRLTYEGLKYIENFSE